MAGRMIIVCDAAAFPKGAGRPQLVGMAAAVALQGRRPGRLRLIERYEGKTQVGELLAVKLGFELARKSGAESGVVRTDCDLLEHGLTSDRRCKQLLARIRQAEEVLDGWSLEVVHRSLVYEAHVLARWSRAQRMRTGFLTPQEEAEQLDRQWVRYLKRRGRGRAKL